MTKTLVLLKPLRTNQDVALLILRLTAISPLFLKHGIENIFTFSGMPALVLAMISDSFCTILMILGLFTRWAAAVTFLNILIAWAFVHHFHFFAPETDHGELIVIYLGVTLTLFFSGPGRYSLDAQLHQSAE